MRWAGPRRLMIPRGGRIRRKPRPPGQDGAHRSDEKIRRPDEQMPPPYSARRGGQPLYKWARSKRPVSPSPAGVIVHSFDLIDYAPPLAGFNAHCGAEHMSLACPRSWPNPRLRRPSRRSPASGRGDLRCGQSLSRGRNRKRPERSFGALPGSAGSPASGIPEGHHFRRGMPAPSKGRPLPDESVLEVIPAIPGKASAEEPSQACRLFSRRGAAPWPNRQAERLSASSRSLGH